MSPRDFELQPPPTYVLALPLLIGLLMPLGLVALALSANEPEAWLATTPVLLLVPLALLMARSMFGRSVRLSDAGLRIRSLPWPRTIPLSDFDLERAAIVDLASRPELMPVLKLMGTRLPGLRDGRFRLRDKRQASVFLTELRRVLVLPLRDGKLVMLSLQRPDALLQAMTRRG